MIYDELDKEIKWEDDDSLSRDIRASIFNNQAQNEEDILSK